MNVSPRDLLDSRFPEEVETLLQRTKSRPADLELEITEKTAITDLPRARAILSQLSMLGVQLASTTSAPATPRSPTCGGCR